MRDGANLRKTARGASSPAKPALHIPELEKSSSALSTQYFWDPSLPMFPQFELAWSNRCDLWAQAGKLSWG